MTDDNPDPFDDAIDRIDLPEDDRPDPDEMDALDIITELDDHQHTMYTCDLRGTKQAGRDDDRADRLREHLADEHDIEYTHEPDRCPECAKEKRIMYAHGYDE